MASDHSIFYRFKYTFIGLIISLGVLLVNLYFNLDLFDRYTSFLASGSPYNVDEIILSATILLFFIIFDVLRRVRKETLENEKLKIYKAMMYSHNHIINNFLNQVLLFKMTAEETPGFDPLMLKQYDEIVNETLKMIDSVGSITDISEDSIIESITPKPPDPQKSP